MEVTPVKVTSLADAWFQLLYTLVKGEFHEA